MNDSLYAVDININNSIEASITIGPYVNLVAAIIEQAKYDWENGWLQISKLDGYNDTIYKQDKKYLRSLLKDTDEYKILYKKVKIYESACKNIKAVDTFLNSEFLQFICTCCNIDDYIILKEFERIKNKYILKV